MTRRERVLTALPCAQPDRLPRCEFGIDRALAEAVMGSAGTEVRSGAAEGGSLYTAGEMMALAAALRLDNITCTLRATA